MGRNITTTSTAVDSTVTKILDPTGSYPANPRTRTLVVNTGTNIAYIGDDNTVTTATGFPLYPVNTTNGIIHEVELERHTGSLYAICETTETATIKVLQQYE